MHQPHCLEGDSVVTPEEWDKETQALAACLDALLELDREARGARAPGTATLQTPPPAAGPQREAPETPR